MTKEEKLSWIISIENSADYIAEELGYEVVRSVLEYYGAKNIEDLNPSQYSEVFSSLYAIEADIR